MTKEQFLKELSDAVLYFDDEGIVTLAEDYLAAGFPALDAVMNGLVDGMDRAGQLFAEDEYFVTDLLLCSDAMYAALDILNPHLPTEDSSKKIKCVIGVVEGDTHDIGKNLVKTMLQTAGFEMYDLGRDVPVGDFVAKAQEIDADMVAMSTLMTTTMPGMKQVIRLLEEAGIRDKVKVLVGGGPISQHFCDEIGADGYSKDAIDAVSLAKSLFEIP